MMAANAAVWSFDVISPFAYLALPEVSALPVAVRFRPVLFAGLLGHWGQLGPVEIPAKRLHTYRFCAHEAARRGVPFRFPPLHPFNPLRPMRLLSALDGAPEAVRAVMDYVWRDGGDVADDAAWSRLLAQLHVADEAALIEARGAKEVLRRNTEQAAAEGVFGVPTLSVGGEVFWGLDALPLARAFIDDPAILTRGELARATTLAAAPIAHARKR